MFKNNKINRRKFMQKSVSIGAGITGASILSTPTNAAPKRGGTLRIGISSGSSTDTFDPTKLIDGIHIVMLRTVCNPLVQVDKNGRLTPELATAWNVSNDGLTWTFKLRKGIKFSNGKEFTASDAVYSIRLHTDKGSKSGAYGYVKDWDSIETDGKYAIKIKLKTPNQDVPWILNLGQFVMLPQGHSDWLNPVGTAGYILESFKAGQMITFKRNPDYWKPNAAFVDKVVITTIIDKVARQNAVIAGQVDIVDNVTPIAAKKLSKSSAIDLVYSTTGQYYCHPMNTQAKPFDDNNVRLAIKHGIERKKILNNAFLGFGEIGNDNPVPKSNEFYNPNLPQYEADPDKAKYYLKKSGYSSLDLTLHTGDLVTGAVESASIMQESLAKANIKVKIAKQPSDGYWSNIWMKKAWSSSWWGARPTAAMIFSGTYKTGAPWNDTFYNNKNFDKLLNTLNTNPNREIRKSVAWEMQEILHRDGGMLIPLMAKLIDAKSTKLKGVNAHAIYALDDYRVAEKAWFV